MSIRKTNNERDIFHNLIDIGLRMYGNGYSYPTCTVDSITEYCRQQLRHYFLQHNQLMITSNHPHHRLPFVNTLVFISRRRKACLKRLQQYIQTKDRSTSQQEEELSSSQNMTKEKKVTITNRFKRICRQLQIHLNNNSNKLMKSRIDCQRSRQYARLDNYYKSDELTPNTYLSFVEQQHSSFNNLRSLSSIDILQWLHLNNCCSFGSKRSLSNRDDLRLTEICLFLIKEILLNLMDQIYQSTIPCQIQDILRRQHRQNNCRLPYSRRKRFIH